MVELTVRYTIISVAAFFPLALVNILRFSIQGMGYSAFAVLAGVLEMVARTGVGLWLVLRFGYTAACFAGPIAWICADMFLIPACVGCIGRLRKKYTNILSAQPHPEEVCASCEARQT